MNTMEVNKIAGAVLLGLVLFAGVSFLGNALTHRADLAENAYSPSMDGGSDEPKAAAKPAGPEPIEALLASADLGKGQKVAKKCASCHDFEKGGKNKTGPALWNVVGRDKAAGDGFKYSAAIADMNGSWGYAELNAFLYKPKDYAPGTKMGFAGLKKTGDRANLIAWLREQADAPIALPE